MVNFLNKNISIFFLLAFNFGISFMNGAEQSFVEGQLFTKRKVAIEKDQQKLSFQLLGCFAEVAMHKANNYLGLGMVPEYQVIKIEEEGKEAILCQCPWIAPVVKAHSSDELKKLVSLKDWENMNIFYALFCQYDRHFGNQLLIKKKEGEGLELRLIDNEAVANVSQIILGYSSDKKIACSWVPVAVNNDLRLDQEPEEFAKVMEMEQKPDWIQQAFPDVDEWTKSDIKHGYCRVWKGYLYRQMYARDTNITAPFSDTISPQLHQKISMLTPEILAGFWPQFPFAQPELKIHYSKIIEKFIKNTLSQKQRILEYFEQHQDGIRDC